VVIGHVDHGKSTLIGHLLYATGEVASKTMQRYERDSAKAGKGSFAFAWVMDAHAEERARGITMDVAVARFETPHRRVTVLDAPGHKEFVPNMITGSAQADAALLVISAQAGEFEAGFDLSGQTREHAILARSLGVQQLIVAVNKLDTCEWREDRFRELVQRIAPFLRQAGYREQAISYVPVSGLTGENLTERRDSRLTSWYTGPTLLEAIDALPPPARPVQRPFRMVVSDVYRGQSLGQVALAGRIEAGIVAPGDSLLLLPANELVQVKTVLLHGDTVPLAQAGDNADLGLTGLDPSQVAPGSILCDPETPVPLVRRFRAQLVTLSPLPHPLTQGFPCTLHSHVTSEGASLVKLIALLDRSTGAVQKKRPRILLERCAALVEIALARPICLELYSAHPQLGRFILRDAGRTVAAGICVEILQQVKTIGIPAAGGGAAAPTTSGTLKSTTDDIDNNK
jgi:elongation factor 1 alpha-like protein